MAKFAPVMPLQLYQDAWDTDGPSEFGTFGNYHLLLAHDVLEHSVGYGDLFRLARRFFQKQNKSFTVIMDNSVVELGDATTISAVEDAARFVDADLLVIPDVMENCQGTIDRLHQNMDGLPTKWRGPQLMFVPQGRTLEEFVRCMEESLACTRSDLITWWGIPRISVKHLGTRTSLILLAHALAPHRRIHLLGFSDKVHDDIICSRVPTVTGIDSAVPVRCGLKGDQFRLSQSDYGKRGDYWKQERLNTQAIQNIKRVRSWVAGHNQVEFDPYTQTRKQFFSGKVPFTTTVIDDYLNEEGNPDHNV